ncbi:MAG: hypothetical protein H0W64_09465 [Gammaproteobacteria bacterium]|nr:hypothetical protein [Gammaproteobacteria bacterium]
MSILKIAVMLLFLLTFNLTHAQCTNTFNQVNIPFTHFKLNRGECIQATYQTEFPYFASTQMAHRRGVTCKQSLWSAYDPALEWTYHKVQYKQLLPASIGVLYTNKADATGVVLISNDHGPFPVYITCEYDFR